MDLPVDDDAAGLSDYAGVVVEAISCRLCRDDRLFPADSLRDVVRHRLGIEPEEIDSGHTPALSHPVELTDLLERIRVET